MCLPASICAATAVWQGFPVRLAPGAPNAVRLLKGHPFTTPAAGEESEEGHMQQVSMTQLAPEQQLVPAEIISGDQLPQFKVIARPKRTIAFTCAHCSTWFGQPLSWQGKQWASWHPASCSKGNASGHNKLSGRNMPRAGSNWCGQTLCAG